MFKKLSILFLFALSCLVFLIPSNTNASTLSSRLSGRILLQVEEKGEAYYINPLDLKAYYLGRPNDAFNVMRSLGLGATNNDIDKFLQSQARSDLAGKILLRVQDLGQAYYVNPLDLKLSYLGRPHDAFNVMRSFGLGIRNSDLQTISIVNLDNSENNPIVTPVNPDIEVKEGEKLVRFTWSYNHKDYYLDYVFSDALYDRYVKSDKFLTYPSNNPPANIRDAYYNVFLTEIEGDKTISDIVSRLRFIANIDNLNDDQFVEFVAAFVQYMPYDFEKTPNDSQNFPYETLYTNKGVCSDFAFLAVLLFREMGYGAAIFDYPDNNHSTVAIQCSEYSSYNSGYCFIELTNYFPVGIFPAVYNEGRAGDNNIDWSSVFDGGALSTLEVYQKTSGLKYNGMAETVRVVNSIVKLEANLFAKEEELAILYTELSEVKKELDAIMLIMKQYEAQSDWINYNKKVDEYNALVAQYATKVDNYELKRSVYNTDLKLLDSVIKALYKQ